MTEDQRDLELQAEALAVAAGLSGPFQLEPLLGGRNNRAFVLRAGTSCAFFKAYFRHPDDPRDRLRSELAFLAHAETMGIEAVTRVLGHNREAGLALFSFVQGRRLHPGEVRCPQVAAALDFYLALNTLPAELPNASEACFSLRQHLDCVERRVGRLARAAAKGRMRADAAGFVATDLSPAWERLRRSILADAPKLLGTDFDAPLAPDLRRASPSDFGFHNALLTSEGALVFLDFEYAGLDDPAKMVCDFFCQPELPVPQKLWSRFLAHAAEASPDDAGLPVRAALLLPAYRLKWCCIMLNDFLALGAARRDFARNGETGSRCDRQLALARRTLNFHIKH
ncbi:MAG: aminoglycoside phosphotransferase family protein [Proteobacteria bacterium]|nr:aminoglycoside phosphotransferase family protein [Pseudomonadota bacterium]